MGLSSARSGTRGKSRITNKMDKSTFPSDGLSLDKF